jgi:hypothetical protein
VGTLDVDLPPQRVRLQLVLTDARSGQPVTRCRVTPDRLDGEPGAARDFLGTNAQGRHEAWLDAGAYRLEVESPDHVARSLEIQAQPPGATLEVPMALEPRGAQPVPVTLVVVVRSSPGDLPMPHARIELLEPGTATPVARFEGTQADGRYSLPARSGPARLVVRADGFRAYDQEVELPADPPEAEVLVILDRE